jgi:hypothetical protein
VPNVHLLRFPAASAIQIDVPFLSIKNPERNVIEESDPQQTFPVIRILLEVNLGVMVTESPVTSVVAVLVVLNVSVFVVLRT